MLQLIANNKFRTYDPLQADAYLTRLATACRACGVRAAEDIYNYKNVLLAKQHVLITPDLVSAISHSKLKKPIESLVYIERELHVDQLEKDFLAVLHNDDFLSSLNEHQDIISLLKHYIQAYEPFDLLRQKLTIMSYAMPEFYQRTIYCTWFALLIAKEMRLDETETVDIFLAGIGHDIGMLHVDEAVLERRSQLSPDDWKHIQSHVYISKKLLESIPHMPVAVTKAAFEHHERCDGTGYPTGKVESELSSAGKIIGLADSVIAIYHNRFKSHNRTWHDVIPVIQMNAQEYFYRHEEILTLIWRRSELPVKNVVHNDQLPIFITELLEKNEQLKNWFEILRDALLSIGFTHGDRELHALQNVMIHLATSTRGSGVFCEERLSGLRGDVNSQLPIISGDDLYSDVTKAYVLQEEIIFHLQRLSRMTQSYVDSEEYKKPEIQATLKTALEKAKKYLIDTVEI